VWRFLKRWPLFSAALQRYEDRSQTVVSEANAIGTTYLRARLPPGVMGDEVQTLLRQYLDVRIQEGRVDARDPALHEYHITFVRGHFPGKSRSTPIDRVR